MAENEAPLSPGVKGVVDINRGVDYETVAASQTDQVIGATGAVGDIIDKLIIIPATTTPGVVTLKDDTTAILSFPGGASSVADLAPVTVLLGLKSKNGAFKITTGANVSVIAVGKFAA